MAQYCGKSASAIDEIMVRPQNETDLLDALYNVGPLRSANLYSSINHCKAESKVSALYYCYNYYKSVVKAVQSTRKLQCKGNGKNKSNTSFHVTNIQAGTMYNVLMSSTKTSVENLAGYRDNGHINVSVSG